MADSNRAVVFESPGTMKVEKLDFPKLEMPNGRKAPPRRHPENRRYQHLRQRPAHLPRVLPRPPGYGHGPRE